MKIRIGILGATGSVGQRFVQLLENHPWFDVVALAASPQSKGKRYKDIMKKRWKLSTNLSKNSENLIMESVVDDIDTMTQKVDLVFSALSMDGETVRQIEESYAEHGVAVVSNNSPHRWSDDVPMIIPEVNPHHLKLVNIQRKIRKWRKGCIVVKPNCSIQSYVAVLSALWKFQPMKVIVTSLQAISGAGKTFHDWPEMKDNVIPFIEGEEEKSEKEPLKIWGEIQGKSIIQSLKPTISSTCIRVPVTDGHMASVSVKFEKTPTKSQIIESILNYDNPIGHLHLPSAPSPFMHYFEENNRPQIQMDKDNLNGMAISIGRLREDVLFDWKFVSLSHNTIRGAAGGAILVAELMKAEGYI